MQHIDALTAHIPLKALQNAAEEISLRYRAKEKPYLSKKEHYLAYLITRFPATHAALIQVFKQALDFNPRSMLDLGAGPGTAYLAAAASFPDLSEATLLEADPAFIALGKQLVNEAVVWQQSELPCALTAHDLVVMSYSLNEIPEQDAVVRAAWQAAEQLLVIVEPGTPDGYQRVLQARSVLLAEGAHMVAPCPNALPCPMQGDDWCHFPARVARSKIHRQLKGGSLGFEDEKFSYLIVAKAPYTPATARVIAPIKINPGHIKITVCTKGQIERQTLTQKNKILYKKCRKEGWGAGL